MFVGVDVGQRIGIRKLPVVDETVVARGALHVDAHENLRDALRGLHRRNLAGVDDPAPDNSFREPLGLRSRIDQLRHKGVIRHIRLERGKEPLGDLFAPAVDVSGAFVIVAQHVIPKREPMLGVIAAIAEERFDEFAALAGFLVCDKFFQLSRGWQQADDIEIGTAREDAIIHHSG